MAIVRKPFKDLDSKLDTTNALIELNKFALKVFNLLSHD